MVIRLSKALRKRPTLKQRREIFTKQNGRCFYCAVKFGTMIKYRRREGFALPHWDHILAFCYSRNNSPANFAAACWICNSLKGGKIFDSIHEAQTYVRNKRQSKGLPVYSMRAVIHEKEDVAKILFPEMQVKPLLVKPPDSQKRRLKAFRYWMKLDLKRAEWLNNTIYRWSKMPPPLGIRAVNPASHIES